MTEPIHAWPAKDSGETLGYTWDFTNLLVGSSNAEIITAINSVTISPVTTPPLVNEGAAAALGNKKAIVRLSGGLDCTEYTISVNVSTDEGSPVNVFERSCTLRVEDR